MYLRFEKSKGRRFSLEEKKEGNFVSI